MAGKGLLFTMPGAMLGARFALEFELVPEGVRLKVAVLDPRDPLKRTHSVDTVLPTAGRAPAALEPGVPS